MKTTLLTETYRQTITSQLKVIYHACSAMSFGAGVPTQTATIAAAIDVIAGLIETSPTTDTKD